MPGLKKTSFIESDSYQLVKKISGSGKVGDHEVLQDKHTGILVFKKSHLTSSGGKAGLLKDRYEKRIQNPCYYMLKCLDYSLKIEHDLCSKFYSIKVYYEYPFYDLEKILRARIRSKSKFLHEEIMYVFYHVLEALCYLESIDKSDGHLQLNTVFYDTELEIYKVVDSFGKETYKERCLDNFYNNNGFKIFTPEVLKLLKSAEPVQIDFSRVDTYCLGVILLALGNLDTVYKLFDLGDFTINNAHLTEMMKKVFDEYSDDNYLLIEIIRDLLIENPKHRPTPLQIRAKFPTYDQFLHIIKLKELKKMSTSLDQKEIRTADFIRSNVDLKRHKKSQVGFKPFAGLSYENF